MNITISFTWGLAQGRTSKSIVVMMKLIMVMNRMMGNTPGKI
jgi:hypothetical protein